ncbi:MAG: hypothetical protein RLY86_2598 [Pseudomonadota bacterium]|jgi:C4-dicarboxylate-specific signal transduction histidine kinase
MDIGEVLRDPAPFMPHGMCLLWDPGLIWLHLSSDVLTALAYYSIPVTLFTFVRRRQDLAFGWIFVLFGLFIAACGTTHALGAWTLWNPDYTTQGIVKAVTAVVSVATATVLWPLMPRALALPSPGQLRLANAALQQEVQDRVRAEQQVREANAELERRVAERTAELAAANTALAAANADLERRVAERTAELAQAAKLATLGSMAAGVAHEVSQPLNAIRITAADCVDILGPAPAAPTPPPPAELAYVRDGLETIRDQAARMGGIVDQLRAFGRRDGDAALFDPVPPLRRAATLLDRHFASAGIRIDTTLPPTLPPVAGRAAQLEQVALNLLSNARDAIEEARAAGMAPAGHITLTAGVEGDHGAGERPDDPAAGAVVVTVADDGIGLAPEVAEHIFEPFFTTKTEQKGMGLGLSICSTIVNSMGGRIEARALGRGVRFTVRLPLVPAAGSEEVPVAATQLERMAGRRE